jgi:hypothetical protein
MSIKRSFFLKLLAMCAIMFLTTWPTIAQENTTNTQSPSPASQSALSTNSAESSRAAKPGSQTSQEEGAVQSDAPSFLKSVDITVSTWRAFIQSHYPWYAVIGLALGFAYLCGLIAFKIMFSTGMFGPAAASVGMWVLTFVLFVGGLLMLPLTLPWWSPLALIAFWVLLTAIFVSALSKKTLA